MLARASSSPGVYSLDPTSKVEEVTREIFAILEKGVPTVAVSGQGIQVLRPVVSEMLGLPSSAAAALIIGFLRKDVGIGMFAPLDLTPEQLEIWGTTCSVALRLVAALIVGGTLHFLLM